jgi:hypothetical protein
MDTCPERTLRALSAARLWWAIRAPAWEHAGVNAGMFHYHFKSKDNYLATLLQGLYETR